VGEDHCAMPLGEKSSKCRQAQESPPGAERRFRRTLPWRPGLVGTGQILWLLTKSRDH